VKRPGRIVPIAWGWLAVPASAQAHLVNSGLGPFYDGALHLLQSPGDLLGLLALALLAGLRGAAAGRLAVIVLPVTWLFAGAAGMNLFVVPELPWLSVALFTILGLLVAVDARLSPVVVAAIAVVFGTLHGLLNGSALAAVGAGSVSLLGIAATVLLLALLTAAAVVPLRTLWARIVVRIAGSWVAAVGVLMLGWLARGAA